MINIESAPVEDEIDEEIYSNEQEDIQAHSNSHPQQIQEDYEDDIDEISLDLPE